ncbi:MAG: Nuclease-related domain, partial [Solirubrobacteraceae bacterium]|nr:Nuclease-related domain [Solirubrobacteraceae bacterium]
GGHAEPRPEPPAPAPPPAAEPEHPVATSITGQWAEELQVRRAPRGDFAYSEFGDAGEEIFLDVLGRALTGCIAIRGLLVARGLDADVLVVGPDGIWLFEVKHWSGTIVCRDGQWTRIRKPGGSWEQPTEPIKPFDRQWEREVAAVERTLGRRLASKHPPPAVRGGLVFTVPDVCWDIDESCRTGYGRPEDWVAAMVGEAADEEEESCSRETQLAILEALVGFGHRIDVSLSDASNDAVELAERLYGEAVAAAEDYVASAPCPDTDAEMPPPG